MVLNSSLIVHTHQYDPKLHAGRGGRNIGDAALVALSTYPVPTLKLARASTTQCEQARLLEQVQHEFHHAPGFTEDDLRAINVVLNGATLELHGNVRTAWHSMTAEQIVRRAAQNYMVQSFLVIDTVLTLQLDRVLRTELQLDIDDLRINVRHGVVAIQGRMALTEQGKRVSQLARQMAGVRVVLNLLEEASVDSPASA